MALRHDGKRQISLWVPADLAKRLKHWAVRRDTTASHIVTRVIEEADAIDYVLFQHQDRAHAR